MTDLTRSPHESAVTDAGEGGCRSGYASLRTPEGGLFTPSTIHMAVAKRMR